MGTAPLGVLLMAYGTPRSPEEIEPYYTHIRHGHPPTEALLADLTRRYEAIGGLSPLNRITQNQAEGLEQLLNSDGGRNAKVFLGMKHAHPFIDETVEEMARAGIDDAVALVLAPHYSTMSVGTYLTTAREAAQQQGRPQFAEVKSWHLHPAFIELLSQRVASALQELSPASDSEHPMVIFSAHSLPQRILELGDPYPQQLHETGEAVAKNLGLTNYSFAWQSAGRTADPWLGPDILDVLRQLQEEGTRQVVICSAGFVADHLEVLYDIDIECRQLCEEIGLEMVRTKQLNADKEFLQTLAQIVREHEPNQSSGG